MEYESIRIGNLTIKKRDVLLCEINGTDVGEYSVPELKKHYFEPNIRLKFKNNGQLYCGDADMLFIFASDGKEKYMLEFELPYKIGNTGENRCETTEYNGNATYIEVSKFDIYSYLNSNAIAKHCKKIGHEFSSAECAYIVNASENHTIKEKHAMYHHIIETMPDEMIKTYTPAGRDNVSLHSTLKDYIKLQNKMVDDFNREDDGFVYNCVFYYDRDYMAEEHGPYRSVNDLFCDVESFSGDVIEKIEIKKISLSDRKYSEVVFNSEKEPLSVFSPFISESEENITECFDLMWFVCPTPFKKGDILGYHSQNLSDYTECFVLESLCYEGRDEKYLEKRKRMGDSSDMTATGYFQKEDGTIYSECMHDYLSLEYFDGKLEGKLRILKALSMYIKGEIWADLFLNAYDVIMKEEELKKAKDGLYYLDDVLKEIGISKEHGF